MTYSKGRIIVGLIIAILVGAVSFSYYQETRTGSQNIQVTGILLGGDLNFGVYEDAFGETPAESINWGVLEPGQIATRELWVRNDDIIAISCTLSSSNWLPEGSDQYLSIDWNWGQSLLGPGRARKVTFTLTVSPSITGIDDFSFTVTVNAS